jgi:hypothetical protein
VMDVAAEALCEQARATLSYLPEEAGARASVPEEAGSRASVSELAGGDVT